MDDFERYKYMSNEDLADTFKTVSGMNTMQGNIRLMPSQKNKIKAFTQLVKDHLRLVIDTTILPLPQADIAELLRRSKTHQLFVSESDTISKAAKTVILMKQVRW